METTCAFDALFIMSPVGSTESHYNCTPHRPPKKHNSLNSHKIRSILTKKSLSDRKLIRLDSRDSDDHEKKNEIQIGKQLEGNNFSRLENKEDISIEMILQEAQRYSQRNLVVESSNVSTDEAMQWTHLFDELESIQKKTRKRFSKLTKSVARNKCGFEQLTSQYSQWNNELNVLESIGERDQLLHETFEEIKNQQQDHSSLLQYEIFDGKTLDELYEELQAKKNSSISESIHSVGSACKLVQDIRKQKDNDDKIVENEVH